MELPARNLPHPPFKSRSQPPSRKVQTLQSSAGALLFWDSSTHRRTTLKSNSFSKNKFLFNMSQRVRTPSGDQDTKWCSVRYNDRPPPWLFTSMKPSSSRYRFPYKDVYFHPYVHNYKKIRFRGRHVRVVI